MKKLILTLLMLFCVTLISSGQIAHTEYYYNGAIAFGMSTTLDSTASTTTSEYFDWTQVNAGSTVYLTVTLVQAHFGYVAGNDTINVRIQGKDALGNKIGLDTTAIIVSGVTQLLAVYQRTLTLTYYTPMIAFEIVPTHGINKNGASPTLKLTLTGTYATIPPRSKIFWQ